jgi:hypothetical protein
MVCPGFRKILFHLFSAKNSCLAVPKDYAFNPGVTGDFEGGAKCHDRPPFLVINCGFPFKQPVLETFYRCFDGNNTRYQGQEELRIQLDGCKMRFRVEDTLDGHDHSGIRKANQGTTMHQASSLGIVDQKGHSKHRQAIHGLDDIPDGYNGVIGEKSRMNPQNNMAG